MIHAGLTSTYSIRHPLREFRDSVEYAYDHLGQRILRRGHDGVRTRCFFAGVTGEFVRSSVPGLQKGHLFALNMAAGSGDAQA